MLILFSVLKMLLPLDSTSLISSYQYLLVAASLSHCLAICLNQNSGSKVVTTLCDTFSCLLLQQCFWLEIRKSECDIPGLQLFTGFLVIAFRKVQHSYMVYKTICAQFSVHLPKPQPELFSPPHCIF